MNDERPLPGGKTDGAILVHGTVRRATGHWTPAMHALLEHLDAAGFPQSPRLLGLDDRGREVLSFIRGDTIGAHAKVPGWAWSEATLFEIGELLRRYHEAVADFAPPPDARWRLGGGRLEPGHVICHNDVGPYNVVWDHGIVGLLDWDFAGPAEPVWDLAYTAWTFIPLHHDGITSSIGSPDLAEAPRRIRLLLDAYGLRERTGFLDVVQACVEDRATRFARLAEEGDPGMARLLEAGHLSDMSRTASHIERNLDVLRLGLR
jgi:hypothetical protein